MEAWRNGSALDSSPKGCVFDSRRFHTFLLKFHIFTYIIEGVFWLLCGC
jgi:hypothetical protein